MKYSIKFIINSTIIYSFYFYKGICFIFITDDRLNADMAILRYLWRIILHFIINQEYVLH